MGEFASKGVAGSGLGLGIAGTALGLLNANGNGGGLLGGLLGGGCQNAQLREQSSRRRLIAWHPIAPAVSATFRLKSVPSRLALTPSRRKLCRSVQSARSRCRVITSG